jgi:hypothetical protein
MEWSGRAPAPAAREAGEGAEPKEHAMSQELGTAIAVSDIDIGKNAFHVVGLDERGAIVLQQKWSRGQLETRLVNLSPYRHGGLRRGASSHLRSGDRKSPAGQHLALGTTVEQSVSKQHFKPSDATRRGTPRRILGLWPT